ncbi:MAG: MarR family transcriptional regulator [Spirochaetales bacterium]|nr:MarR family transcriptional regulator [Spirochaetales bacterium]
MTDTRTSGDLPGETLQSEALEQPQASSGENSSSPSAEAELVAAIHGWMRQVMHASMQNFLRYIKDQGLSMSQMGALFQIYGQRMCGVTYLGEELGITSAAASQLIDRLVQQGLLKRSEDPKDRRSKVLKLTSKGERLVKEAVSARQSWVGDLVKTLNQDESVQVAATLAILTQKSQALGEGQR